jgi:hypothetical protein
MLVTPKLNLFNDFPRSMGSPAQDVIAYNKEQFDEYIKERIEIVDLYTSVYKFMTIDKGEINRNSAYIDKAFFDFDSVFWLQDLRKVYFWCKKHNIVNRHQFSGNGAHSFIYIVPNVHYKKEAIGNFQRWLSKELNLTLDKKIIGDTSRIFRIKNTYNFKAKRYCISIPPEILEDESINEDWFYKNSTHQQDFEPWSGENLLNISNFDTNELMYMEYDVQYNLNEINKDIQIEYSKFPPCVQSWLSTPNLHGKAFFYLVLYLRDQNVIDPLDTQDIIDILAQILSKEEFAHKFDMGWMRDHIGHCGKKVDTILRSLHYSMSNCETLKKYGLCTNNCYIRNPILYKNNINNYINKNN